MTRTTSQAFLAFNWTFVHALCFAMVQSWGPLFFFELISNVVRLIRCLYSEIKLGFASLSFDQWLTRGLEIVCAKYIQFLAKETILSRCLVYFVFVGMDGGCSFCGEGLVPRSMPEHHYILNRGPVTFGARCGSWNPFVASTESATQCLTWCWRLSRFLSVFTIFCFDFGASFG